MIAAAGGSGATIIRAPEKTFYGGYGSYFTDLDGYVWQIAHNPGFSMAEDGSITIPDFIKA